MHTDITTCMLFYLNDFLGNQWPCPIMKDVDSVALTTDIEMNYSRGVLLENCGSRDNKESIPATFCLQHFGSLAKCCALKQ